MAIDRIIQYLLSRAFPDDKKKAESDYKNAFEFFMRDCLELAYDVEWPVAETVCFYSTIALVSLLTFLKILTPDSPTCGKKRRAS